MTRPWTAGPWRLVPWSEKEGMIVAGAGEGATFISGYALKADGNLLAEAPDLYEALAALVESHIKRGGAFDEPLGSSEQSAEINTAVAVLARARGEKVA